MPAKLPMPLSQRLYLTSGVLIAALVAVVGLVWVMMQQVAGHAESIRADRVPQLERISELELNVTRASLQLRHAILARTPQEQEVALADILDKKRLLEAKLIEFGRSMTTDAGRAAFAPMTGLMETFWKVGADNIRLIQAGDKAEAFAALVDKTIPARNALLLPLVAEKKRQGDVLASELVSVAQEASTVRNVLLAAVVAITLGMFGFAAYVVRVMRQLGGEPAELKRVADAVAAGDLTTDIVLRDGDTTSTMAALKTMSDNLARTVQSVRQNAETVATASAEIAQGNQDLSSRTEQQASALEETAATMEQLSATVRSNADSAQQANELALTASSVAGQGGEVVGKVVSTMKGINESSRKIGDIISVIDGIAFQTNILALNAAVEAARAGEQGRGFAVVASEVRSLAQRSAEAAKEIKVLIGRSVEQVDQGTVLVDQAGKTMNEIVGSIQRVSNIVAEISSASAEQSNGVRQVGEAVSQMDQATQQNAALVEQSAAAAESLKGQALQLVQAVEVFRLSAPAGRGGAAVLLAPPSRAEMAVVRHKPQPASRPERVVAKLAPSGTDRPHPAPQKLASTTAPVNADEWASF